MDNNNNFFGIPFQVYDDKQLSRMSCDALEEPALFSIFFVSGEQCNYLMEADKTIRESNRVAWVPVKQDLASLFSKKERHTVSEFSIRDYLDCMYSYLSDTGAELYLLMDTEEEVELVLDDIRKTYPYLPIQGLAYDTMASIEATINEINSVAPEILLVGLHVDEMRHFLETSRNKTNARLCICVGELLIDEMSKKRKLFHTNSMGRRLKKKLRKYNKREQKKNEAESENQE